MGNNDLNLVGLYSSTVLSLLVKLCHCDEIVVTFEDYNYRQCVKARIVGNNSINRSHNI